MLTRRRVMAVSAVAALATGLAPRVQGQTIGKAARMVVGFPPGGSSDVVARLLVEQMRGYAPSIIVDNRPGAGGRIAMDVVKAGSPDGSIMVLTPASMMVLYPHLYKTLSYDPLRDFVAVTSACSFPFVISVGPMVPRDVKTLADFIGWCRANPRQASYGTSGAGSMLHFAGMMLARAAKFEFTHVPYKGATPALQDLLGGQIPATVGVLGIALPHIQAGSLRALATSGASRSSFLPDVPTLKESGYPDLVITEWQGIFVPAKTPSPVVEELNRSVRAALAVDEVKAELNKQAFEIGGLSSSQFTELLRADIARWEPIVKESGFTPEN
jgi:tripartite-type tricarboxylate transporter receptor subunit TctC